MATFRYTGLRVSGRSKEGGFSLVEVVLAIGVVSFAILSITSLVFFGLSIFQKGMQISISEQIAQKVITDAQQTNYATLVDSADWTGSAPASFRGPLITAPALRYFDAYGDELVSSAGSLYQVNTVVVPKATYYPVSGSAVYLPNTVLVRVEVVANPGNTGLQFNSDGTVKTALIPSLNIYRFNTLVAQSQ